MLPPLITGVWHWRPNWRAADPRAGIDLRVKQGQRVSTGESLFTVHAESPGELDYALDYLAAQKDIITLSGDGEAREQRSA